MWHAVGPISDPEITFDVARAVRVYVMTDHLAVSAKSLQTGVEPEVQWMVADVAGPLPTVLQQHVPVPAGSYDSDSDNQVRPPWFAARLMVDASSGAAASVTFYADSTAVAVATTAAWPAAGVPLAGITRITATVAGGPARLVWLLEM
jgi:hypothetical protein